MSIGLGLSKQIHHVNNHLIFRPADSLPGSLHIHRLVRKNLKSYGRIISYRRRRLHLHDLRAD